MGDDYKARMREGNGCIHCGTHVESRKKKGGEYYPDECHDCSKHGPGYVPPMKTPVQRQTLEQEFSNRLGYGCCETGSAVPPKDETEKDISERQVNESHWYKWFVPEKKQKKR